MILANQKFLIYRTYLILHTKLYIKKNILEFSRQLKLISDKTNLKLISECK